MSLIILDITFSDVFNDSRFMCNMYVSYLYMKNTKFEMST